MTGECKSTWHEKVVRDGYERFAPSIPVPARCPRCGGTASNPERNSEPEAWCDSPSPDGFRKCRRAPGHPGKHAVVEREWS